MISRSSSATSNLSQQETNVRNLNLQDIGEGAVTVADSDNVTITTTDFGALDGVFGILRDVAAGVERLGAGALQGSADVSEDVLQFGGRALDAQSDVVARSLATVELATTRGSDAIRDVSEFAIGKQYDTSGRALDFGESALRDVRGTAESAIGEVRDTAGRALDFGERVLGEVGAFLGDTLAANRTLVQDNIAGLTALARDTSQTGDDRIVKVVAIAIGGVALIFVANWLMRSSG